MLYFLIAVLIFILLGLAFLRLGQRRQQQTGLPIGEVIYSDTGAWQKVEAPLISRRYGLIGKPDYLVQVTENRQSMPIPVEVKSRKRPAVLYANHALQLATYCLLIEEQFKRTPPYGLLHYADATLKIEFTQQLRDQVIEIAEAIRRAQGSEEVSRSHEDPGRCRRCGYLHACGKEALH
ncbi:MAG: CRISPR-associated protein Cas4 [Chloroflexi bacterium]|nr:CRISPR-associated protein Cas4 [Chloroflexota bacterium]